MSISVDVLINPHIRSLCNACAIVNGEESEPTKK